MIHDVLFKRVAHLIDEIDMHVGVARIHLAAAFIDGHEDGLYSACRLCHEACRTRRCYRQTGDIAASVGHDVVVELFVGTLYAQQEGVVALTVGAEHGERSTLLCHDHGTAVGTQCKRAVYAYAKVGGLLRAVTQSECGYHVALGGDVHARAASLSALVLYLFPEVAFGLLHLIALRVVGDFVKNGIDFLQFQIHDVVHYALRHCHMLGEFVVVELRFLRERFIDIRIEVDGKQAA